jgi:hypothetical protein
MAHKLHRTLFQNVIVIYGCQSMCVSGVLYVIIHTLFFKTCCTLMQVLGHLQPASEYSGLGDYLHGNNTQFGPFTFGGRALDIDTAGRTARQVITIPIAIVITILHHYHKFYWYQF